MIPASVQDVLIRRPADYTLRWPRKLFVDEARALAAPRSRSQDGWSEQVTLLLEEAFVSDLTRAGLSGGSFQTTSPAPGRTRSETS